MGGGCGWPTKLTLPPKKSLFFFLPKKTHAGPPSQRSGNVSACPRLPWRAALAFFFSFSPFLSFGGVKDERVACPFLLFLLLPPLPSTPLTRFAWHPAKQQSSITPHGTKRERESCVRGRGGRGGRLAPPCRFDAALLSFPCLPGVDTAFFIGNKPSFT